GKWVRLAGGIAAAVLVLAALGWISLWIYRRHKHAPPLIKKRLRWAAIALAMVGVPLAILAWRGNSYIEHDARFCTSCHIMNSAYQAWGSSGHKDVECHACHLADIRSNLHQLWMYTTEKPDNVIKHAFVDRKACEKCHQSGSAKMKWGKVAETPGHKQHVGRERIECVQCHGLTVHRFKPTPELCAGCHTQVSLAAAGSMAEMHCLECHPFLAKDASRPLKPDRAVCLECHTDMHVKNESFPKDAPMAWACGECHKPHKTIRIGQADCLECHEAALGKGIHAVKSHSTCLSCHQPHGWKVDGREPCMKCHPDRKDHNADNACAECHGAE
ncbi:MAG: NapC/NirT family cytochrome c, partial [Myxococcaceae bacterium]